MATNIGQIIKTFSPYFIPFLFLTLITNDKYLIRLKEIELRRVTYDIRFRKIFYLN